MVLFNKYQSSWISMHVHEPDLINHLKAWMGVDNHLHTKTLFASHLLDMSTRTAKKKLKVTIWHACSFCSISELAVLAGRLLALACVASMMGVYLDWNNVYVRGTCQSNIQVRKSNIPEPRFFLQSIGFKQDIQCYSCHLPVFLMLLLICRHFHSTQHTLHYIKLFVWLWLSTKRAESHRTLVRLLMWLSLFVECTLYMMHVHFFSFMYLSQQH